MRFKYGTYLHDVGEVDLVRNLRSERSSASGLVLAVHHNWSLRGRLIGTDGDPKTIATKAEKLRAAYAKDNVDCGMLHSDGSKVKEAWLTTSQSLAGVRVLEGPSFPQGDGSQGVTFLDYTITIGATFVPDTAPDIKEFSESLTFSGGGPTTMYLEPIYGTPVKVLAKQNTIYRVVQRGRAVGLTARPSAPGPLWPADLSHAPVIGKFGPRLDNGSYVDWGIEWTYEFESALPMFGNPNTL